MNTSTSSPISSGKNLLLLALISFVAAGIVACSGDDIEGDDNPVFVADPSSLLFEQIDIGDNQPTHLRITNEGSDDLELSNFRVVNEVGNSLSLLEDPGDLELEEDEYVDLTIEYAPQEEAVHAGYLSIDTNDNSLDDEYDCPNGDRGQACVQIETQGFAPELHVSNDQVPFQAVPDGLDENHVRIRNIGAGDLDIHDIYITEGDADYAISFFDDLEGDGFRPDYDDDMNSAPDVLESGEDIYMRIRFTPDDENPSFGNVRIESNDIFEPSYDIELLGNTGDACLEVVESSGGYIDFGPGSINATNYQTVTLRNCSPQEDLEIFEISISDDGGGVFSVEDENLPEPLPGSPAVLSPGEVTTMLVGFAPQEADVEYDGELFIESTDSINEEKYIPLTGIGVDSDCPIAEVAGAVGMAPPDNPVIATNQEVVNLTAEGSYDPDDGDLTYEWSIIDRPDGSLAEVVPSNVEQPQFTVDIVGDFVIELEVFDDTGLSNCQPAILEIWATPMEDIHIQLVWDSPTVETAGGIDTSVQRGTDLDIHYVRPGGSWGDPFDSIYWQYDEQDWNDDGSNNARLDIDDLWGSEPENINHSEPEIGLHEVGVHFYRDYCWGPADATVRIYFGETLIEEMDHRLDQTDNFWYVGNIDWQGSPDSSSFNVLDHDTETHSLTSHWDVTAPGTC